MDESPTLCMQGVIPGGGGANYLPILYYFYITHRQSKYQKMQSMQHIQRPAAFVLPDFHMEITPLPAKFFACK